MGQAPTVDAAHRRRRRHGFPTRWARAALLSTTTVAIVVGALAPAVAENGPQVATPFSLTVRANPHQASAGDTVTYTYEATNTTGASYLAEGVQVVDNGCASPARTDSTDPSFDAGDTWTYTCARGITADDPNPVTSTAQLQVRPTSTDAWQVVASFDTSVGVKPPPPAPTQPTTPNGPPAGPKSDPQGPPTGNSGPTANFAPITPLLSSADCPFADSENATECVISSAWSVSGGNVFPSPLPGPFAFHKNLHITSTGSINATQAGAPGITLTIDGASGGTGALLMDTGALIDTSDAAGNGQPGGPISIDASGGATLAAGSTITSENNSVDGNGGNISLTLHATSTLAGLITSAATAGTTSNSGGDISINVTGDLTMASTAKIDSHKQADSGEAGDITITVSGDMTMQGTGATGALISAEHPGATNGTPGGNITITVGTGDAGTFTMQNGSRVDSSSQGFAGNIAITAGLKVDVQTGAKVLAGQIATQDTRGHGGRIFVIAGCTVNIFGTLSSQGRDPGADLVHVEGCEVHVGPQGLIESTGAAHDLTVANSCDGIDDPSDQRGGDAGEVLRPGHPDNSTVCVEIWARHVTLDQGGEVNADFALSGGTQGHGWIDIFAEQDVTIDGPASGSFAVHTDSHLGNDVGGDLTVKAKNSFVALTGQALQANAELAGSNGGHIIVGAGTNITLDSSSQQAKGGTAPNAGGPEIGGTIENTAGGGTLTGGPGGEINTDARTDGTVTLLACNAPPSYTGTVVAATYNHSQGGCGTPTFPAYVVFNTARWNRCGEIKITGKKFDSGHNNVGLSGWTIRLYGPDNFNNVVSTVTDVNGNYSFGNLVLGVYHICEVLQATWTQTSPVAGPGVISCNQGGVTDEGPLGYEVDTNNFVGECCSGATIPNKDFGNVQAPGNGTKSGMKWNDLNGDGVHDNGEPAISGWPINLYGPKSGGVFPAIPAQSTLTDAQGNYTFSIPPGDWRVCEGPAPTGTWLETFPKSTTVHAGETITTNCPAPNTVGYEFNVPEGGVTITGNDFGNFHEVTKSGVKWNDVNGNGTRDAGDNPLSGWEIRLYDDQGTQIDSKTTDQNGAYSFGPLGPGTFTVCEVLKSGWIQTYPNASTSKPNESIATNCLPPNGSRRGYTFTTQSGVDLTADDFGNFEKPTKSGIKWEDVNGNGTRDNGDNPLSGWEIRLYDDQGAQIDSDTTDANGAYSFGPLDPGTYTVCEVLKTDWVQTFPNAGTSNPPNESIAANCPPPNGSAFGYTFTAKSGTDLENNDFGNFHEVTKSGVKWEDVNGNGTRDAGDNPLSGWEIRLYDDQGNQVDSKTTDQNGAYSFGPLGPGTFTVCEVLQANWVQTYPNASTSKPNESIATNCLPPNGNRRGYTFTTKSGTNLTTDDFGNFHGVTKSGVKWEDVNGNGTRDAGDNPLSGWEIRLYDDQGNQVDSDTTDANGAYSFGPLGPGTYTVCEVLKTNWLQTYPNASTSKPNESIATNCLPPNGNRRGYTFTVKSGVNLDTDDFGNFHEITKSGIKWNDVNGNGVRDAGDNPLSGWEIRLYDDQGNQVDSDTTDANGAYSFGPLGPGTFTVCEVLKTDWIQTYPNASTSKPNESIADNCLPPNGNRFGYTFTTSSGTNLTTDDFGNFHEITKSGIKWNDVNGNGVRDAGDNPLSGWDIKLYDSGGNLITTDTTDGSGAYSFGPLGPGTYTVCEVLEAGWLQTFPNASTSKANESIATNCQPPSGSGFGYTFTAQSGVNLTTNDFGNFEEPTKSGVKWEDMNGNGVRDNGDDPLSGWTIQLFKGSTLVDTDTTDGNGAYSFTLLQPGTYTVCEVLQTGWEQTFPNSGTADPPNESIATTCSSGFGYTFTAKSGVNLDDNDFGNWVPPTKSGVKWNDLNGNGVRDSGDDGLSGWTIEARDPSNGNAVVASAVTDGSGNYELTFPKGGTFRVCEVLQTNWTQTFPNASTPDPSSPEDVVNLGDCPGGLNGYDVTVASRDALTDDDFGNHLPETPNTPPVEVGGITVTVSPSTLAFTGSDTGRMIVGAFAALLIGACLVVVTRRRRRRGEV